MKKDTTRLFVYGTLRRDPSHDMSDVLVGTARFAGDACVEGRLYDLGAYPGLVLTNDGHRVRGEVYELSAQDWTNVIEKLDAYEGCTPLDPAPHEYRRELIKVEMSTGQRAKAWAYILNRHTAALPEIESGDFIDKRSAPSRNAS